MKTTNSLAILLIAAVATCSVAMVADAASSSRNVVECVKIERIDVSISELADDSSLEDNGPGIVTGLRSCGGSGKLHQMRYETCSGEPGRICQVPGDNIMRRAELHFTPSEDIQSLAFRLLVSTAGIPPTVIFDKSIEDSAVRAGSKYSINADVGASQMFRGRTVTLQFELYREHDNDVEVCSKADFEIV